MKLNVKTTPSSSKNIIILKRNGKTILQKLYRLKFKRRRCRFYRPGYGASKCTSVICTSSCQFFLRDYEYIELWGSIFRNHVGL